MLGDANRGVGVALGELALGVVIGVLVPYLAIRFGKRWFLPPSGVYKPLNAFAIGLLVLALSYLTHANIFFAVFTAGITIRTFCPPVHNAFKEFGEAISQLLKLAALMVFGALLSLSVLLDLPLSS